jgi:hypothetical protein
MQALGRSRGGFSTKIHLIADAHCNPVDFLVSPGQTLESHHAIGLLMGVDADGSTQITVGHFGPASAV